ncbi:hypothetical protein ACFLSJ_05585 [Verrucomicrobiota bacterium]
MKSSPDNVFLCSEGYRFMWDKENLQITTTDYHVKPLRLPWKTIAEWMRRAQEESEE